MNSLKILVNSWESFYPVGKRNKHGSDFDLKKGLSGQNTLQIDEAQVNESQMIGKDGIGQQIQNENDIIILDQQLRTSIDHDLNLGPTTQTYGNNDSEEEEEEEIENQFKENSSGNEPQSFLELLLSCILFIPMYILVKPLMFIWIFITYPITSLFEGNGSDKMTHNDNNPITSKITTANAIDNEIEIDNESLQPDSELNSSINPLTYDKAAQEKIEMLKQENIISNTIKSPSLALKYLIPPPQRLFPLSRNPNKRKKKKTLILDLDETLIHSLSRGLPRSFSPSVSSKMIEIKLQNISSLYYVYKRPYCDFFLREVAKWFELQIFTASVKEYADPIINWLEQEITPYTKATINSTNTGNAEKLAFNNKNNNNNDNNDNNNINNGNSIFTKRYYRTDCTYRPGVGYIKDLLRFFEREDDLKNVIILDNLPVSYALHENNAVQIEGWINDQTDRDLINLLPMLHSLSLCIDVRYILGLRGGERVFEN